VFARPFEAIAGVFTARSAIEFVALDVLSDFFAALFALRGIRFMGWVTG
jgi:hypothetical protein